MKSIKLCISTLAVLFVITSLYANTKPLFIIERSKNANIVRYDANIDSDGSINKKNPIDSYWLLHNTDGRREEIGTFEKKAYGYSAKYNEEGWFDMRMKAVEGRDIKVFILNGEPKAEMIINAKNAYLSKVYINSKDNFAGIPKVIYYTLTGNDTETGEETVEKIEVK